nr:YbgA family protein [Providencia heimbachae]
MAYSPIGYQLTGKLVAELKKGDDLKLFFSQYKAHLMEIFGCLPSKNIQVNALSHMQGYFKRKASPDEKKHLLGLINDYREGSLPISQPLAMMQQLLTLYPDNYLSGQYYFEPYPNCEKLRKLPYF